ncbi:hypothetical protein KRP22_000356 [Phytophthora ramorum]|uniref:uncharacterized protein n=1 Tax=Phytophthora ramorum TaxID=164328 RepID=UPI003095FEAC|nr:hypothetical protein KRP23_7193 [Phytophthora ramorum]KAH7498185.1 hypothetical protein KRP22_12302 [Phytophthora ramorum]
MADRLIHQRVFKVSKALNRLDLLCGQHRRQMESREGLPDWEKPRTPAGKASKRYETTPAFFAWDEEPKQKQQSTWQTQSPQKVARTLEMTEDAGLERSPYDISMEEIVERSVPVEDGTEEDTAIEVDSDDRSEEEQPQVVGRSITVSPAKEDILDRVTTATTTTNMMPSRSPTRPPPVEVSPSPFHSSSSPRG